MTLQNGLKINYLNFPRYETANSMKYYFNREFMILIMAENVDVNMIYSETITDVISFSRDRVLVIISDHFENSSTIILRRLFMQNFINVVYLDVENFANSQEFLTFHCFPFKLRSRKIFKKEEITDING